jgi:hypothetical protein
MCVLFPYVLFMVTADMLSNLKVDTIPMLHPNFVKNWPNGFQRRLISKR